MDETLLFSDARKNIERSDESGIRSINIEHLGDLREISENTMIPVARLVNFGVDLVRLVIFSTGMQSDAYKIIKEKARDLPQPSENMEFCIIRTALDIMAEILKKDSEGSVYEKLVHIITEVSKHGKQLSLRNCAITAINKSLSDPKFIKTLLNEK